MQDGTLAIQASFISIVAHSRAFNGLRCTRGRCRAAKSWGNALPLPGPLFTRLPRSVCGRLL